MQSRNLVIGSQGVIGTFKSHSTCVTLAKNTLTDQALDLNLRFFFKPLPQAFEYS